jgi:hypothetical protein
MHVKRLILVVAVGAAGLGFSVLPAAAAVTPGAHLTGGPRILRPFMEQCVPEVHPGYAHISRTPGQVSAHAWWSQGTCTKAQSATVLVLLEEKIDGKWQQEASAYLTNMFPGNLPLNRQPNARENCRSNEKTYWRSYGIVHVAGYGNEGDNHKYTPEQLLNCHV